MRSFFHRLGPWLLAWAIATAIGGWLLANRELSHLREAFETDARIVHRLLSQRVVQHDAILATLALLQTSDSAVRPEQRLPSVYPQILSIQRRDRQETWGNARIDSAQTESRRMQHAALGEVDLKAGRYQLILGAEPTSFLLLIDIRSMVPWSEWPMAPDSSPVQVSLEQAGNSFVLQPGSVDTAHPGGWHFEFHKLLAAPSQPFTVWVKRDVGWSELPWAWMLGWAVLVAVVLRGGCTLQRQRHDRRRAQELLRLGQVARLNTLGELAAGMAHELNQPLTAVLANTQAATRLLADEPPDLPAARHAMQQTVAQARRAAEVVGRLRRAVERPDLSGQLQPVNLEEMTRKALYLLEPELKRRQVQPTLTLVGPLFRVLGDPVALEQIIHNLLMNGLQALDTVALHGRSLSIILSSKAGMGQLTLQDNGPGLEPDVLPRIFEPFFTTREGGLGLGLSLCETLASGMGGALTAANRTPHGAEFRLTLPLAPATQNPS